MIQRVLYFQSSRRIEDQAPLYKIYQRLIAVTLPQVILYLILPLRNYYIEISRVPDPQQISDHKWLFGFCACRREQIQSQKIGNRHRFRQIFLHCFVIEKHLECDDFIQNAPH